MFKRVFYHGISAGILAALAAVVYIRIHKFATYTDFSSVLRPQIVIAANLFICMLAALVYWAIKKLLPNRGDLTFHFLFTILSFAAIIIPISMKLPLNIESPELFPGLVIPMLFFPALAWFTLKPAFVKASALDH